MAARAYVQLSATTHTLTSGCCVRQWPSDVVALVWLRAMDSCMPSVATMRRRAILHRAVLIVLNGTDIFTELHCC